MKTALALLSVLLLGVGCGSDANSRGVGAECTVADDCTEEGQSCLDNFAGGYCGISACTGDADCPDGSACITHDDAVNYCFLVCLDKADCNENRSVANEANCNGSGTVTFVDDDLGRKVCVPPTGG
jgi:hypothetical protein